MTDPTIADLDAAEDPLAAATVDLIDRLDAYNAETRATVVPALDEYRDQSLACLSPLVAWLESEGSVLGAEVAYRLP